MNFRNRLYTTIITQLLALSQHGGSARRIYEDDDVPQQLRNFYQEVAKPLLMNVQFTYRRDIVLADSLTRTSFKNYFSVSDRL